MGRRFYVKGQQVIANCGTKEEPEWIPGIVLEVYPYAARPYEIKLEQPSEGARTWYFGPYYVIDDNPRNRHRKGLA